MLIPPEDCPQVIWDLMRSCWKTEPRDRIRFPEIYARLKKAQEDAEESPIVSATPLTLPMPPQHLTSPSSTSTSSSSTSQSEHLPRPPGGYPIPNLSAKTVELLDSENYLLPQVPPASKCEYLQPLPD